MMSAIKYHVTMAAPEIATFVFLDLETTGLPWQERNQTKIIELSLVAAARSDILHADCELPPFKKLSFLLNPTREVHPEVVKLTGLGNDVLKDCPLFKEQYESFKQFLKPLPRPLCIVAHNGNSFDYKILLAEVKDARRRLPKDLLCIDSLVAFRKIDRDVPTSLTNIHVRHSVPAEVEDEWPDLDISAEDWQEIDEMCERLSDISTDPDSPIKGKVCKVVSKMPRKIIRDDPKSNSSSQQKTEKRLFALGILYKRLTGKEPVNSHRAECDCLMLLECVVAMKHEFVQWADRNCKPLSDIQPLARYKQTYSRHC